MNAARHGSPRSLFALLLLFVLLFCLLAPSGGGLLLVPLFVLFVGLRLVFLVLFPVVLLLAACGVVPGPLEIAYMAS